MKKKYISPTIDFEFLEEDDILAASGSARTTVGSDEDKQDQENDDIGIGDDGFIME